MTHFTIDALGRWTKVIKDRSVLYTKNKGEMTVTPKVKCQNKFSPDTSIGSATFV